MEHFATPSEGIVGYTAGLIDGEGSIYYLDGSNRFSCSVAQSETNNGEDLVRWLQHQWGVGRVHCQRKRGSFTSSVGPSYDCWIWAINTARGLEHVLVTCLPYLRVKRHKAEGAITYTRARVASGSRVTWSPGEDAHLRAHWREHDRDIAAALGRPERSIRHRGRLLGLPRKPPGGIARQWGADEDAYLRSHLHTTNAAIGTALGRSRGMVRGRLQRLDLHRL